MKLREIEQETEPKGKRSIRANIYGNLNGYISGKFWVTFGDRFIKSNQEAAENWKEGNK